MNLSIQERSNSSVLTIVIVGHRDCCRRPIGGVTAQAFKPCGHFLLCGREP
jgi:hypothetical protein